MNILKGYLTYLVALCALVYGVYLVSTGDTDAGVKAIWVALGVTGVRRAIGS